MRATLRVYPLVLSACALAGQGPDSIEQEIKAKANVTLDSSATALTQTSNRSWTLDKSAAVNTANSTVTWTITATPGATTGGHLVSSGVLSVTNWGGAGATIGNIVVNLQTRSNNKWVTKSSDIADATHGDAATTANVVANMASENHTVFNENSASGALSFTDQSNNTLFSLVPQVTIPAHTTVNLTFSAVFDNNVLGLAPGTRTRTEILVTFGNHPAGGPWLTDTNVDINGNGVIDPDEAKVRTVQERIERLVPATQAANASVTITDTVADLATRGTVTYSNPVFNLGATTGTVSVTYDGGTAGGSITNCAHATGAGVTLTIGTFQFPIEAPVELETCNTTPIEAHACVPGAPNCGWHDGDMLTYTQADWGDNPDSNAAATALRDNYDSVYAATFGVFEVGIPGSAGYSTIFTGPPEMSTYLPAVGQVGALDHDLLNPTSTASGAFGGEVVGLKLNVDFSDAGVSLGTSQIRFGSLTLCNFSTQPALNGLTVRQLLGVANTLLGGGSAAYTIDDVAPIVTSLNGAFFETAVSTFAQDHLINGTCP
jgi:hypothetical protein